jgi:hypothetical protein
MDRRIAIVVLMSTDWKSIKPHTPHIARAIETLVPGSYVELPIPPAQI